MTPSEKITQFLTEWSRVTRVFETSLIDNVAATTPWLTPIIPAFIAYQNLLEDLRWPVWVALVAAASIEFLGLSTVSTIFHVWGYNQSLTRKTDPRQSIRAPLVLAVVYISLVVVVNVLLDAGQQPVIDLVAQCGLSLLSVVAAATMAIRAQTNRLIAEHQETIKVAKAAKSVKVVKVVDKPLTLLDIYRQDPLTSASSAAKRLGVSRQTVYNRLDRLQKEGVVYVNGNGVEIVSGGEQ